MRMRSTAALVQALRHRLSGLPRSLREFDASLLALATLREVGWMRSRVSGRSVCGRGKPVPWMTYPATMFMESVIQPCHRVLEFGAGHSTLWFSSRARRVVAFEHNALWVKAMASTVPLNVEVLHRHCGGDKLHCAEDDPYLLAADRYAPFDIVCVDGVARVSVAVRAADLLCKVGGLIVFDNLERKACWGVLSELKKRGFGRIDFFGLSPGNRRFGITSVFSRDFRGWLAGAEPPNVAVFGLE